MWETPRSGLINYWSSHDMSTYLFLFIMAFLKRSRWCSAVEIKQFYPLNLFTYFLKFLFLFSDMALNWKNHSQTIVNIIYFKKWTIVADMPVICMYMNKVFNCGQPCKFPCNVNICPCQISRFLRYVTLNVVSHTHAILNFKLTSEYKRTNSGIFQSEINCDVFEALTYYDCS